MRPVVGVSACNRTVNEFPFHAVNDKYVTAVRTAAGCAPIIVPPMGEDDVGTLIERLDGILLTGSPSNVEPRHYGGHPSREGTLHDPGRDATTLPLIRAAVAAGVPVFAICRGHQELNVALGGTLHQLVHEVPGRMDHRRGERRREEAYAPRHALALAPGGYFARLLGTERIVVNSLHAQGIDRVAPGLTVEATAEDGTIEAVRVEGAKRFAVGVQWHAEWRPLENPVSAALFKAFGEACRERLAERAHPVRAARAAE